jgi:hypothetical protein
MELLEVHHDGIDLGAWQREGVTQLNGQCGFQEGLTLCWVWDSLEKL